MFLKVWSELKKDGVFFSGVGLICGVVQYLSFNYLDQKELGSSLLQEHIAFNSMMIMVFIVVLGSYVLPKLPPFWGRAYLVELVSSISNRAVSFGVVATSVIFGFSLAALFFQAFPASLFFLFASLYFLAISEVSAFPRADETRSKCYWSAAAFVAATPFLLRLT